MKRTYSEKLFNARVQLDTAASELREILLSSDTVYATQEASWQEGDAGHRHCKAAAELRATIEQLRNFELPTLEELG